MGMLDLFKGRGECTWFPYEFYPFLEFIKLKELAEKERDEDDTFYARGKEFHEAIHINIHIYKPSIEFKHSGELIIKFKYTKIWWMGHGASAIAGDERSIEQKLEFGGNKK